MVMCLEPLVVLPDRPDIGGVHLEDVVVVHQGRLRADQHDAA